MIKKYFWLFLSIAICCSCNSNSQKKDKSNKSESVKENNVFQSYDLSHPLKKWVLPDELKEISGQAWIDKNHLLAIEDLHPTLYLLRLDSTMSIEKTSTFKDSSDKKFDLEDITIVDEVAYALWSHGKIYKITSWQNNPGIQKFKTGLSKENNTEGLCYDPVSHNLLIACKNESDIEDEKKSTRSIFEFDLKADTLKMEPFLLIHKKDFEKFTNEKLLFFPSAIAVHPITHDIYILSTKDNKCMAQYSYSGELKSLQFFDKDLLPQPEGICFAPDGTIYISTEGRHGEQAAIFEFSYSK
jgi:uncharacterized protein YjiK